MTIRQPKRLFLDPDSQENRCHREFPAKAAKEARMKRPSDWVPPCRSPGSGQEEVPFLEQAPSLEGGKRSPECLLAPLLVPESEQRPYDLFRPV